jgi:hypothetical protein
MGLKTHSNRQIRYSAARLEWLLQAVDDLHSAASDGTLDAMTPVSQVEVQGWLSELIWVAQEALVELEKRRAGEEPRLSLVRKSS